MTVPQIAVSSITLGAALIAASHAIIYKREPRSAAIWVIVIFLLPLLGPTFYLIIGINRVERRAARLREDMVRHRTEPDVDPRDLALRAHALPGVPAHLLPIGRLVSHVISRPLLPGNRIEPLVNGEHAYPAMLAAIDAAQQSVGLASYIFHGTSIGAQFVEGFNALSSVAWRYVLWSTMSMPASLDGQP